MSRKIRFKKGVEILICMMSIDLTVILYKGDLVVDQGILVGAERTKHRQERAKYFLADFIPALSGQEGDAFGILCKDGRFMANAQALLWNVPYATSFFY